MNGQPIPIHPGLLSVTYFTLLSDAGYLEGKEKVSLE